MRFSRVTDGGFTLVEVLMAAFILTLVGTGILMTAWKLTGLVREEAQRLAADAYCSDVAWAVYNQKFSDIESIGEYKVSDDVLPLIEVEDAAGTVVETRWLLRRGDAWPAPTCRVDVTDAVSNKTILVRFEWSAAQNVRLSHSNVVVRANVSRGEGES